MQFSAYPHHSKTADRQSTPSHKSRDKDRREANTSERTVSKPQDKTDGTVRVLSTDSLQKLVSTLSSLTDRIRNGTNEQKIGSERATQQSSSSSSGASSSRNGSDRLAHSSENIKQSKSDTLQHRHCHQSKKETAYQPSFRSSDHSRTQLKEGVSSSREKHSHSPHSHEHRHGKVFQTLERAGECHSRISGHCDKGEGSNTSADAEGQSRLPPALKKSCPTEDNGSSGDQFTKDTGWEGDKHSQSGSPQDNCQDERMGCDSDRNSSKSVRVEHQAGKTHRSREGCTSEKESHVFKSPHRSSESHGHVSKSHHRSPKSEGCISGLHHKTSESGDCVSKSPSRSHSDKCDGDSFNSPASETCDTTTHPEHPVDTCGDPAGPRGEGHVQSPVSPPYSAHCAGEETAGSDAVKSGDGHIRGVLKTVDRKQTPVRGERKKRVSIHLEDDSHSHCSSLRSPTCETSDCDIMGSSPVSTPSHAMSVTSPLSTPSPLMSLTSPAMSLMSPAMSTPSHAMSVTSPLSMLSPLMSVTSPAMSLTSPAMSTPSHAMSLTSPDIFSDKGDESSERPHLSTEEKDCSAPDTSTGSRTSSSTSRDAKGKDRRHSMGESYSSSSAGGHKSLCRHSASRRSIEIKEITMIVNEDLGYITSPDISSEEEEEEGGGKQEGQSDAGRGKRIESTTSQTGEEVGPSSLSKHQPGLKRQGGCYEARLKVIEKLINVKQKMDEDDTYHRKRAARGEVKKRRAKREKLEGDFSGSCLDKIEYNLEEKPSLKRPEPKPEEPKPQKPPKEKKEKPKKDIKVDPRKPQVKRQPVLKQNLAASSRRHWKDHAVLDKHKSRREMKQRSRSSSGHRDGSVRRAETEQSRKDTHRSSSHQDQPLPSGKPDPDALRAEFAKMRSVWGALFGKPKEAAPDRESRPSGGGQENRRKEGKE